MSASKENLDSLPTLPPGWVWTNLKESSLKLQSGGTPSKKVMEYYENGTIPFVKIEDMVNSQKYLTSTITKITQTGLENSAAWLVPKKSLLYSMYASYGVPIITKIDVATNQAIIAHISDDALINIDFIFYYLLFIKPTLKRNIRGTTQENLNANIVSNLPIVLAPYREQHRIVTKIEELLTQLDAGVASLKKAQAQLKRYQQAVLKAAFEGRLTQEWRGEHKGNMEPADVLFKKIKREHPGLEKEIAKRLPLYESELFLLPNEWIWVQAQDVCENISNGYTPTADKLFDGDGDIPFIKVYNLTKTGAFDFSIKPSFISRNTHETELKRSAVYPDDILMSIVGPPMGKVSLVPKTYDEWNINQAIVIYRTFPEYSRKLMLYVILSETIQKWLKKRGKTTAGQTNYTITMSRSLPVPLPPFDEQSIIVDEIERHFSQIDHIENTVETSLRQAESLRQSILKRAFEGKLVPQDPTDEPASVLLERIKSDKAHHAAETKKGKTLQPKSPKRKIKNAN